MSALSAASTSNGVPSCRAVVTEALSGLDASILDYIVGLLDGADGEEERSELCQPIAALLVGADFCDEETAEGKAKELVSLTSVNDDSTGEVGSGGELVGGGGRKARRRRRAGTRKNRKATQGYDNVEQASTKRSGRGLTAQQRRLQAQAKAEAEAEAKARAQAAVLQAKLDKKAAKRKKLKANSAGAAAKERERINAQLEAASVAAVTARSKMGTFKGHLAVADFTLPNPGGGQNLLEDASMTLVPGRVYGLIGRNGSGKSTCLRALASRSSGDLPENLHVHYVSQEVNLSGQQSLKTPLELVVDADIERRLLLAEVNELEEAMASAPSKNNFDAQKASRLGDAMARLVEIESETAEVRAKKLLENLGFADLMDRALKELSGGWRVRTMLAAAIFAKPDLLLLDEPTNHLSIRAILWLARELKESQVWKERVVVIVSHDRSFMDEVCTDMLHISGAARRLAQQRGNFSVWSKVRAEKKEEFAREVRLRQAEIDKLREYAGHGFRYGGSSSQINKMKMKEKQACKLEEEMVDLKLNLASLKEDIELPLHIASGGEVDGFIVQMKNIFFGYTKDNSEKLDEVDMLLEGCEMSLTSKSRLVILGENGVGKTTILKLLTGTLLPLKGDIFRSPHARFAIVNQHHADQIDMSLTPLQFMLQKYPGNGSYEHTQKLRSHLASCGVTSGSGGGSGTQNTSGGSRRSRSAAAARQRKDDPTEREQTKDMQNTPAVALSGGQRARVAMASVSFARPHCLILDEPTNNLDIEACLALAETIRKFEGAVICVSHDQAFVSAVANEALLLEGRKLVHVDSFEAYCAAQMAELG